MATKEDKQLSQNGSQSKQTSFFIIMQSLFMKQNISKNNFEMYIFAFFGLLLFSSVNTQLNVTVVNKFESLDLSLLLIFKRLVNTNV